MNEVTRLTFLAANYGNLRSLRLAPFYALFIADPWLDYHRISVGVASAWVGVSVAWFWLLDAYYTRRFGKAESNPNAGRKPNFWKNPANLIVHSYLVTNLCVLVLIKSQYGRRSWPFFLFAMMILGSGMTSSNILLRRSYYVAANASTLLLALAVIIRRMPWHLFASAYAGTFLGVMLLALGVLDHLVLTHTFRKAPRHDYA